MTKLPAGVEISGMEESDLDDIMRIETENFTDAWEQDCFVKDMNNGQVFTFVARRDGRCIGYTCCLPVSSYGYIANLAVDSHHQSQGVGRALVRKLCDELAARDIHAILLDVRPSNQQAVQFYERYGFTVIEKKKDFYSQPNEDSYTMLMEIED